VKLMRISLRTLMVLVALAAVDSALVRATWGSRHNILTGIALTVLAVNGGLILLIRSRGRVRAFWVGFALAGLLAAGSFGWAMGYPRVSATFMDQATGTQVTLHSSGAPLSDEWERYLDFVEESIETLPDHLNPFTSGKLAEMLADASIAFVAQLAIALLGGLLFWLIAVVACAAIRAVRRRPSQVVARQFENVAR
jgi:hypothetical protein